MRLSHSSLKGLKHIKFTSWNRSDLLSWAGENAILGSRFVVYTLSMQVEFLELSSSFPV